nr:MAG: DNA binding/packing protein [Diabrotica toursvirus 3a]
MNIMEVDNFITYNLYQNIQLLKKMTKNPLYNADSIPEIGGRISREITKFKEKINELKFYESMLILYKIKTSTYIQQFLNILRTPISSACNEELNIAEHKKRKILKEYFLILKTCVPYSIVQNINYNPDVKVEVVENYCEKCNNTDNFIKQNDIIICKICYSEIVKMAYYNNRSYNLNITKCNYDRTTHFKECLKQFQGKQNTFINPEVYNDIIRTLRDNAIKDIKKSHIIYFLKELGYSKHYDDYILIYSNITGVKPNDLGPLEELLINDFEQISETYNNLIDNSERKNFINIQYILYCLLKKYNYNFDEEDFLSVKSSERKIERNKICKKIFKYLNWPYHEDKC